ncbi:restriction endonuclease subunit S [Thiocapsa sp.]|uniref:restriction endonuclease subunit S n=1 Tax=Thiocapsa sp. TaxID=2024551 RepID=UPI00359306F2
MPDRGAPAQPPGEIFGLVGKTAIYKAERPAIFAGYLIRINVDKSLLYSPYLNYVLNAEFSRKHSAKVLSVAVGQANINGQKLKSYPIPLPPSKAEQEAIAEALSDADAFIESLEQLIAKKRQIKQGAMQELLTGKRRLPGFSSERGYQQTEIGHVPKDWEVSSVGEEFSIQLGKMLDVQKNTGVAKPFLGNRAVQWGCIDLDGLGEIKLTSSDLMQYRLRDGDLLVCEGGEIGRAAIWRESLEECYYQKALHRLRPKRGYSAELMFYVLYRFSSSGFLFNFVTQTSIAHLPKDKFETVPIPVPPQAEQTAISSILSDMDAEITALEDKLAKARRIKQGMMQELLTGRIRLM